MKTEEESLPRPPPSGAEKVANLEPKKRPKQRQNRVKIRIEVGRFLETCSKPISDSKNIRKWSQKWSRNSSDTVWKWMSSCIERKLISSKHSITFPHFWLWEANQNPSKKWPKSDPKSNSYWRGFDERKITNFDSKKSPLRHPKSIENRKKKYGKSVQKKIVHRMPSRRLQEPIPLRGPADPRPGEGGWGKGESSQEGNEASIDHP